MIEFYAFAGEHPAVVVILALIAGWIVMAPFTLVFRCYNRTMRSRNIAAKGWPPEHLDADGDFKQTED